MEQPRPTISHVFGARLRFLRQVAGYSQEVVAERANISQTYLSALERGQKFPASEVIETLAQVYGVEYFELFIDTGSSIAREIPSDDAFVNDFQVEVGRFARAWITKHKSR